MEGGRVLWAEKSFHEAERSEASSAEHKCRCVCPQGRKEGGRVLCLVSREKLSRGTNYGAFQGWHDLGSFKKIPFLNIPPRGWFWRALAFISVSEGTVPQLPWKSRLLYWSLLLGIVPRVVFLLCSGAMHISINTHTWHVLYHVILWRIKVSPFALYYWARFDFTILIADPVHCTGKGRCPRIKSSEVFSVFWTIYVLQNYNYIFQRHLY